MRNFTAQYKMERVLDSRTVMDRLPPAYSENLRVGESRVDHSPSRRERRLRETWLKTEGSITIALSEQMKNIDVPRYVRRDHIHGAMLLDNREVVSSVTIKLSGQLRAANTDGGRTLSIVEIVKVLWAGDPEGTRLCPGALPFDIGFPDSYVDEQEATFPLPPTFSSELSGILLDVEYLLIVEVSDRRRPALGFISRNRILRIPITYRPRTRPSLPLLQNPSFLTSVKTSPEEWRQTLTVVKTKANVNVQPIHCNLFIPAVQTFSVSDNIPFHIQMTAPSPSLRLLFTASTAPWPPSGSPPSPTLSLVVNLVRQISLDLNGKTSMRNIVIGSSSIRSVPPPLDSTPPHATQYDNMDWEGQIRCNPDVVVGGFTASGVTVKDYIVLELHPPPASPFMLTRNGISVLIVTDPWTDDAT